MTLPRAWFLLVFSSFGCGPGHVNTPSSPAVIIGKDDRVDVPEKMKRKPYTATGRLVGNFGSTKCSASLVGDGWILTANHCALTDYNTYIKGHWFRSMAWAADGGEFAAEPPITQNKVTSRSAGPGFALLRTDAATDDTFGSLPLDELDPFNMPAKVMNINFSHDYKDAETAGLNRECTAWEYLGGSRTLGNDCDLNSLASGSALLAEQDGRLAIVGVQTNHKFPGAKTGPDAVFAGKVYDAAHQNLAVSSALMMRTICAHTHDVSRGAPCKLGAQGVLEALYNTSMQHFQSIDEMLTFITSNTRFVRLAPPPSSQVPQLEVKFDNSFYVLMKDTARYGASVTRTSDGPPPGHLSIVQRLHPDRGEEELQVVVVRSADVYLKELNGYYEDERQVAPEGTTLYVVRRTLTPLESPERYRELIALALANSVPEP